MIPTHCRRQARLVACSLAVAAASSGCGEETPERAIYALAHDLEHGAHKGVCGRLFPGGSLPRQARRALALERDLGPGWNPDEASCRRALAGGALAGYELVEPRVRSVTLRPLEPSEAVEAIATAQVALDGRRPVTLKLALVAQRWRVIPETPRTTR
jgi:hypothetical protein